MITWQDNFFKDFDSIGLDTSNLISDESKKYRFAFIIQYGPTYLADIKEDIDLLKYKFNKRIYQVLKLAIPDSTEMVILGEPIQKWSSIWEHYELLKTQQYKAWTGFQCEHWPELDFSREREWRVNLLCYCNLSQDRRAFFRIFSSLGGILRNYKHFIMKVHLVLTDSSDHPNCTKVILDAPIIEIADFYQKNLGTFYMRYPKEWIYCVHRLWEAYDEWVLNYDTAGMKEREKSIHYYTNLKRHRKNPLEKLNLRKKWDTFSWRYYMPKFKLTQNTG